VVRGYLRGHILLTLEKRGDVALQVDDFPSDGLSRTRPDEAAAKRSGKYSGGKDDDGADFHEKKPPLMWLLLRRILRPGKSAQTDNRRAAGESGTVPLFIHFNGRAACEQEIARSRGSVGH
jgi:hypothetical protein